MARVIEFILRAKNEASKEIEKLGGQFSALEGTMAGFKGIGKVAILGYAAMQVEEFVSELMVAGAQYERIRDAFEMTTGQIGENSTQVLAQLRAESKGMISDTDLMLSANKAIMLNVADSGQEIADLMKVATVRGRAFGLSAQQAFEDIVTGIGRASPRILDNIGIIAYGQKVFEDYAASIGKATDELDDMEKKQALLNLALQDLDELGAKDVKLDTAGRFEQGQAAIENSQANLGRSINESWGSVIGNVSGLLQELEKSTKLGLQIQEWNQLRNITTEINEQYVELAKAKDLALAFPEDAQFQNMVKEREDAIAALKQSMVEAGKDVTGPALDPGEIGRHIDDLDRATFGQLSLARAADEAQQATYNEGKALAEAADAADALAASNASLVSEFGALTLVATRAGKAVEDVAAALDKAAAAGRLQYGEIYDAAEGAANRIKNLAGEVVQYVGVEQAEQMAAQALSAVDATAEAMRSEGNVGLAGVLGIKEAENEATAGFEAIIEAAKSAGKEVFGFKDIVAAVADELDKLNQRAQALINSSLNVDRVDVDWREFMPHVDDIQENAFRVADIMVNGFKDQSWLEEFKNEAPDVYKALADAGDPQAAAAQVLRDFEDGLVPELIDKDAAKERIKRMILGEQNTKALAAEITAELAAEMGLNVADLEGTVGAALGLDKTKGITEANVSQVVGEVFNSALANLYSTGQDAGTNLSEGVTVGVMSASVGEHVVTIIDEDIKKKENVDSMFATGQSSGVVWGNGFIESVGANVPPALIGVLANLVSAQIAKDSTASTTAPDDAATSNK